MVIPKGAESYDPEKAGESVGEEGGISTVDATIDSEILADPIDLSKTVYTNSNGSGYTRMDGDDYVLRPKAGSWTSAKTGHAHAEWSITNRFGITGYKVNWEKTSGKPCYTYTDYSYCEKDPGDSGYEWKTELDTKDERWSSTNINIYSSKAAMSRIAVIDYKYRGNYSCTPKLTIHSMTPILRPFEVQLMNADASALKFVDEEGNFVQHDQLAETSHAGETSVVGGTIKWAKEGMDTISVKTNDSRYSWIKYLEIVRVDDKDPKKILSTNRCAGPFPTGTQVASVQLTESRLNWLGNNDYLDFSKNVTEKGSFGLKGKVYVRAVLEPYPADFTVKNDDVRAELQIIQPENTPSGWVWHRGDYITVKTVIKEGYENQYTPVGVNVDYRKTGNENERVHQWNNIPGKDYVCEQLEYSKLEMWPDIQVYNNRLVAKVSTKILRYYDQNSGLFKNATLLETRDGYRYYLVEDSDTLIPNVTYALEAKPVGNTKVAGWKQDTGDITYYENTHYFRTSRNKEENVVELLAPKTGDVRLELKGTAFYSGATLDRRVEGEAWLPAEGALACFDDSHFDIVNREGEFTLKSLSTSEEQDGVNIDIPLYACSGEAFTYKIISSGDETYYSGKADGTKNNGVLTVDSGKHKVPAINYNAPYIAAATAYDPSGVNVSNLPITDNGISNVVVTVNNCGAEYIDSNGNKKKENTAELELLVYHPHNAEPITLAKLSKNPAKPLDGESEEEEPYVPVTEGNTEKWEFRVSAKISDGIVSGDKMYLRLITDRGTTAVYDENGNPVTSGALNFTKYPPLDTGSYFIQPAGTIPETIDWSMYDNPDFMSDYVKLPILGSFNCSFRAGSIVLSMVPLPGNGQRIYFGYIPEALKHNGDERENETDTGKDYGLFKNGFSKFGTAWQDMKDVNNDLFDREKNYFKYKNPQARAAANEGKFMPLKHGGGCGGVFGIYFDYGRKIKDGEDTLEFMGAGAFAGFMAWYRLVYYWSIYLVPMYIGFDIQFDALVSMGVAQSEDHETSALTFSGQHYLFDFGISMHTMFNAYVGVGICNVVGVRGGFNANANAVYMPMIKERFPNEDSLLKKNGYSGLRPLGFYGDINGKIWIDAVIGTIPITFALGHKSFGYFKDLENLEKIYADANTMGKSSSSVGSSTDSDETSASAPKFKYKQAGDPSVWKATSQNPTKSTYTQLNDVELKTGGYDRADAQLIDLGDDKTLLVYVDEDSRIQGDDRTVLRYQVYDKHETWLGTPGVIQAKNGNTNVNGALEPKLTDAGDKIMITWTAAVLPNATHDDEDYMQKYLKQRNVYVALADKSALRSASSDAPVQIDGELVSTVDASRYNSTPSPLYYKDGDQEYFAVTYLSSEAEAPDDSLTDEEKLIAISSTMTNNSYVRTAEFNTDTNKWETEFDVMKLNSTYDAATQTWTPISDDESLMTDNNPTVIDLDNTVWKDWTVYTFTVDKDNDLSTEEDREVFVKIENFKTGNETVNQLTNDAEYTDAEGTHHLGIAESRPQLIQAAGSLYLFWQSGDSDVAWLDIGSVIDSQDTNGDTGLITNKENTACSFIFYPAYGVDIEPSYNGFKPFVDEKGNLYVVWEQGIEEDGVLKQELYAQALKVSGEESELSYNWSDPARLTRTDAGDYSMVFNDEPAVIAIEDRLLVVCNRFGSTEDGEDTTAHDLSMHGIQFFSDASVKVIDVDTTNTDVGPGSDLDFDVTVKNDGLKSAGEPAASI